MNQCAQNLGIATSPGHYAVNAVRETVIEVLKKAGLENPRVFGSVARGKDHPNSDLDLLVTSTKPIGLLGLARIEEALSNLVGMPVDLVLDSGIREDLRSEIIGGAMPL